MGCGFRVLSVGCGEGLGSGTHPIGMKGLLPFCKRPTWLSVVVLGV